MEQQNSLSSEQEYTEFGVFLPLTERSYFTSPVFSSSEYFARLGNKILTPLIISGRQQQQQALEQQKQIRGGGHARTQSAYTPATGRGGAGGGPGGIPSPLSFFTSMKQDPSQVAESLVDLHEEALEMLEKLRLEEQQKLVELEKACAITESSVRGRLSKTRDDHCVSSVATLNGVENLANAALTVTSGVRAEMAAASNRIARGQQVLQLFEIFDACTAVEEMTFQNCLAELAVARHEARESVLTAWRVGSASASATSPLASISAAAIHGQLFFQSPLDFLEPSERATEAKSPKSSSKKLEAAESDAITHGMPAILVRRSQVPQALDVLRKLVPLAEAMKEEIPSCQNIIEYDMWYRQQLTQEILQLMMKFGELHTTATNAMMMMNSSADGGGADPSFGNDDSASAVGAQQPMSRLSMLRAAAAAANASSSSSTPTFGGNNNNNNNNNNLNENNNNNSGTFSVVSTVFNNNSTGSGSREAERQAESRRLILLSSIYAKLLMASLDFVSRLHSVHHESPDTLVQTLREFIVGDLKRVAAEKYPISLAPAITGNEFSDNPTAAAAASSKDDKNKKKNNDHDDGDDDDEGKSVSGKTGAESVKNAAASSTATMAPSDRVRLNSREAAAAYDYFLFELLWDLIMIEAMFGASYPGVRAQVSLDILQRVVRDFSKTHLEKSEARRVALIAVVEKLSPNQSRNLAEKIIAELNYHNEFLAIIISHVQRIHFSIVAKFDDLKEALQGAFAPVFAFGDTYSKAEYELQQLTRLLRHQTEFHLRDFQVAPDGVTPYDLVPAHEETMKQGFDAAETALRRAKLVSRSRSVATVSTKLCATFQAYVASFVEKELQKASDMLRREAPNWNGWPQRMEKTFFTDNNPVPNSLPGAPAFSTTGGPKISVMEPLYCAMRLCRWGLSSLARLSRFMQLQLAPTLANNPELVAAWITERTRITVNADRVGSELLTYIAAGTTTKALALLSYLQNQTDFVPSETGRTADLSSSGTAAALHYQHFLLFTLQEAEPLLKQIFAAANAEQEMKSSSWDRQRQEALLASRRTGDALRKILREPKVCASSFVLDIGYALFKGLCCHLRSHPVNDIGVLIMKRDVAIYRNAINLLFKHSTSEENFALSEMFDVLKELMNLLMVPLDNIRNVKATGLLKEFHNKDIVEFLQMRQDIGKALADSLKL